MVYWPIRLYIYQPFIIICVNLHLFILSSRIGFTKRNVQRESVVAVVLRETSVVKKKITNARVEGQRNVTVEEHCFSDDCITLILNYNVLLCEYILHAKPVAWPWRSPTHDNIIL